MVFAMKLSFDLTYETQIEMLLHAANHNNPFNMTLATWLRDEPFRIAPSTPLLSVRMCTSLLVQNEYQRFMAKRTAANSLT